jgi:uncharacterized protein
MASSLTLLAMTRSGSGADRCTPHIALMPGIKTSKAGTSKGKKGAVIACPICGKAADAVLRPFCSKRCADVDLHRWLSGRYVVPVTEDEEEDERREDNDDTGQ